eukprot:1179541-Prorocentrum_minimum.AAC.2
MVNSTVSGPLSARPLGRGVAAALDSIACGVASVPTCEPMCTTKRRRDRDGLRRGHDAGVLLAVGG